MGKGRNVPLSYNDKEPTSTKNHPIRQTKIIQNILHPRTNFECMLCIQDGRSGNYDFSRHVRGLRNLNYSCNLERYSYERVLSDF